MEQLLGFVGLVAMGVAAGTCGTLVGLGGGFILVPFLLILYPDKRPDVLTAVSLAVVMVNSISGSVAYGRMRRIDLRSGMWFALATMPGAILGTMMTNHIKPRTFSLIFGAALFVVAVFLLFYRKADGPRRAPNGWLVVRRSLTETSGVKHEYSFSMAVAMPLAFAVGFVSSLLGVGGGIIHVPAMINLLGFPVHIATATSVFVLIWTTMMGTAWHHFYYNDLAGMWGLVLPLAIGVTGGAQIGAGLSRKIHGRWIVILLAVALCFVGVRIFLKAW